MSEQNKVGCEREDGLLNIHSENTTCEVCHNIVCQSPAPIREQVAPSYWNSQRKMIERAIVGLRDGWATRQDADAALAVLGSSYAPIPEEVAQASKSDGLTIGRIGELITEHTDKDFGLIVEPFARAIEREVLATQSAKQGAQIQILRDAIEKQLDSAWQCNSDHPVLAAALKATEGQTSGIEGVRVLKEGVSVKASVEQATGAQEVTQQAAPTESQERDYKWLLGLAKSKGYSTVYSALYATPTTQQAAKAETGSAQEVLEILVDYPDCRHVAPIKRVTRTDGRLSVLVEGRAPTASTVSASGALAAADDVRDPIRELVAQHAEMLETNAYTYFELAYTRRTEWMAWLCTNARESDPDRNILASGQGSTPEEACESALDVLRTQSAAQAATDKSED